jgi:hypothetical protein
MHIARGELELFIILHIVHIHAVGFSPISPSLVLPGDPLFFEVKSSLLILPFYCSFAFTVSLASYCSSPITIHQPFTVQCSLTTKGFTTLTLE